MEAECLRHQGASTIGSQLLAEECSHELRGREKTGTHYTDKTVERGEGGKRL